jgi:ABC-type phosphate transport system ATPase subunit
MEQGSSGQEKASVGMAYIESVAVKKKQILHSFHLDFPSNSVTAILGPSGSGKSERVSSCCWCGDDGHYSQCGCGDGSLDPC